MKTKALATIVKLNEGATCYEKGTKPAYLVRFSDDTQMNLSPEAIGDVLKKRGSNESSDSKGSGSPAKG